MRSNAGRRAADAGTPGPAPAGAARAPAAPSPGPQADVQAIAGPAAESLGRAGAEPGARAVARPPSPASRLLTVGALAGLQRAAGNRATVQALGTGVVVQRAISIGQAERIAGRLEDAMSGWGTDEEAVYGALSGRTPEDIDAIRDAYLRLYDRTLQSDINDEFSGDELARANKLLEGQAAPAEGASAAEREAARGNRARDIAAHLKEAMEDWGTEEDEIFNALEGRDAEEIQAIQREYLALTGNHLDRDLQDELSGDDLRRALDLLGVEEAGTFTNEIEQAMTEGETTVVRGRFEYVLQGRQLTVRVPVEFRPDEGVSVPLAEWQGQIDDVWNGFAAVESGGSKVPIKFSIENRSGADKTIRVKQNKKPGERSVEDRANAGMWFPIMKPTTAPHEFGHLVGLQDEYMRTHGDYRRITGDDKAGPRNTSGKTAAEIAKELHDALYLDEQKDRGPAATAVLAGVGLIVGGIPQQGDFAQEVQAAYDDEYSGWLTKSLIEAMRDKLADEDKWTIQSVFSYASRSIMGNPETLGGVEEHDHSVEPRHLAEFVGIVRRNYPGLTWEPGPA